MKEALKINHNNDEFFTPTYAVKPLLKYIPRDAKRIWCPCDTYESRIVQFLEKEGFEVQSTHIDDGWDFLSLEIPFVYDMIITNPPYSIKNKIIKRCYELGKPFALLLPLTGLEGEARCEMYDKKGIGIDDVLIGFYEGELQQFDGFCDCSIKEVLAPVPSYDKCGKLVSKTYELVQKVHILNEQNTKLYNELCDEIKKNNILKKRLAIAAKALKEYAEIRTIGQEAREALKEIDFVGTSTKGE